ncbi:MAG: NUDIX hydrolase [Proteobacteria bacterium]|nr:NUDIX hydrolase [Pseudomonadota bacterium]
MKYKNPVPTVDIVIEAGSDCIVLIQRKNEPYGWALPGGFVDYGESLESAAVREAKEETSLDVKLCCQLHTYSDPERDPRQHTISTAFVATADGQPVAGDDAAHAAVFAENGLPENIVFDHRQIIEDYYRWKKSS